MSSREIKAEELNALLDDVGIIGRGGFGTVRLCTFDCFGIVAVKCIAIRGSRMQILQCKQRIERELRAILNTSHPHIVCIYGITRWDFNLGIVMEYLPGGTLYDLMSQFNPRDVFLVVFRIICDISTSITYLHNLAENLRMTHGDIKGQNIFLTGDLRGKLGDFGSAFMASYTGKTTQRSAGRKYEFTVLYAPPERLQQRYRRSTTAGDVYSLGMTSYAALATSEDPLENGIDIDSFLQQNPDLFPHDDAGLIQFFVDVIKMMISPRPEDRPTSRTVSEMLYNRLTSLPHAAIMQQVATAVKTYQIHQPPTHYQTKPLTEMPLEPLGDEGDDAAAIQAASDVASRMTRNRPSTSTDQRENQQIVHVHVGGDFVQGDLHQHQHQLDIAGDLHQHHGDLHHHHGDLHQHHGDLHHHHGDLHQHQHQTNVAGDLHVNQPEPNNEDGNDSRARGPSAVDASSSKQPSPAVDASSSKQPSPSTVDASSSKQPSPSAVEASTSKQPSPSAVEASSSKQPSSTAADSTEVTRSEPRDQRTSGRPVSYVQQMIVKLDGSEDDGNVSMKLQEVKLRNPVGDKSPPPLPPQGASAKSKVMTSSIWRTLDQLFEDPVPEMNEQLKRARHLTAKCYRSLLGDNGEEARRSVRNLTWMIRLNLQSTGDDLLQFADKLLAQKQYDKALLFYELTINVYESESNGDRSAEGIRDCGRKLVSCAKGLINESNQLHIVKHHILPLLKSCIDKIKRLDGVGVEKRVVCEGLLIAYIAAVQYDLHDLQLAKSTCERGLCHMEGNLSSTYMKRRSYGYLLRIIAICHNQMSQYELAVQFMSQAVFAAMSAEDFDSESRKQSVIADYDEKLKKYKERLKMFRS